MVGVINQTSQVGGLYSEFISTLPSGVGDFVNLFLLTLAIVTYSIIIWNFYKFIARKDIIKLNLQKNAPEATKITRGFFYLIENILIAPFLVFLGFSIFSILLILVTENLEVGSILIISAVIIAAVRMTAYYKKDLAKDLAKTIPFALLALALTNPTFFHFETIFLGFTQLSTFFSKIPFYIGFAIVLEIILRVFDSLLSLMGVGAKEVEEA